MAQRTTEWIEKYNPDYHDRQFVNPYQSTIAFCDWLESIGYISADSELNILDVACGKGANMFYMAKRYPKCNFVGVDINDDVIKSGNEFFKKEGVINCCIKYGDIYNMNEKHISAYDAIVSYQTLSWLPEFKKSLAEISKLDAKWIALTSLFYDGPVDYTIELINYDDTFQEKSKSYYNIYSLPVVEDFLKRSNYIKLNKHFFEIDVDLEEPTEMGMKTFTRKLENGKRIQMSGALLMPWYFIGAEKSETNRYAV